MQRNFVRTAVLGIGAVLLAANLAHAQGHLYGYYYPDEKRFHYANEIGRSRDSYGVPTFMQPAYTPAAVPFVARANPAKICLIVPAADARVWFENQGTKSTGTSRVFETPPITPGSIFQYHLKVTWKESGEDVSLERDVAVRSGQTVDVDFTEAAAALRKSRAAMAALNAK